jgi:hypothetical protein
MRKTRVKQLKKSYKRSTGTLPDKTTLRRLKKAYYNKENKKCK